MFDKVFIVGEIGINHNGDVNKAIELIRLAKNIGFDAVKFQKRNPELYPDRPYNSPLFGEVTYKEHKRLLELSQSDYEQIDQVCLQEGIEWFASCFDIESVDFIKQFNPKYWKIASPCITNIGLIRYIAKQTGKVIISTGMSTIGEVSNAVYEFRLAKDPEFDISDHSFSRYLALLHCCSEYPCPVDHVNLNMILTLKAMFPYLDIGYSSHDATVAIPVSAVAMGASIIEVHITADRSQRGSDHAASLEHRGMETLVRHIRAVEKALGSCEKQFYPEEQKIRDKVKQITGVG